MIPVKNYFIFEVSNYIWWKITKTNHWFWRYHFYIFHHLHLLCVARYSEFQQSCILITWLIHLNRIHFWRIFQTVSSHLLLSSRFSSITNVVRRSMRWSALSHKSWFRFTASRQIRDSGTVACSDAISVHKFCTPAIFYRSHSRNIWLYKEACHPCVICKAAMHTLEKLP